MSFADVYLRDVPEGHWANEAVYKLVKMGVTGGFPDGTYVGGRDITRCEMASFLSKLYRSLQLQAGINEKLAAELKNEVAQLKYENSPISGIIILSGTVEGRICGARDSTGTATRMDYRLQMAWQKIFDQDTSLRVGLDTMDTGYDYSQTRRIATQLVDAEGKFKVGELKAKAVIGQGKQLHTESDGLFPSENNIYYPRPNSAIEVGGNYRGINCSGALIARQFNSRESIAVQEINALFSYDFSGLSVLFWPRYFYRDNGLHDLKAELGANLHFIPKSTTDIIIGIGSLQQGMSGLYGKLDQSFNDPLQTNTNLRLRFDAAGNNFRTADLDKYEVVALNNFNRLIFDGKADLGFTITQLLPWNMALSYKSDWGTTSHLEYGSQYVGTYFEWEGAAMYYLSPGANISLFYRSYEVPSGIGQFSETAATVSCLMGLSVKCIF
ncbi:MAG: S-layer homology domain-containing protein [Candidatus Margulisbacteria bacterium]|nr:S-layer homology domain-containing protein [Candidatus Margulisiibacteriota bacterium]